MSPLRRIFAAAYNNATLKVYDRRATYRTDLMHFQCTSESGSLGYYSGNGAVSVIMPLRPIWKAEVRNAPQLPLRFPVMSVPHSETQHR